MFVDSAMLCMYLTLQLYVGIKVGPGMWRGWPRYLLDPYHTAGHSKDRSSATANRGTNKALTDNDSTCFGTIFIALIT